ncbi:Histone deacetylase 15 isoform 1 [Tripterygium wilfordii]|uniref:histone deacetylase n=1 Tax=Tripterygium wilfordii TaxID=458696 RepID=A0A7J7C8D4_TRIWF|nr:histone deacetylase 15 isoform X1 [Tripterygium wilfordii]KAF5730382.1 Histone deacetylase 15 isoform 1 [Tripterygium wilfordii]
MVSETAQVSCQTNGEAKKNPQKESHGQGFNGKRKNLCFDGTRASPCNGEVCNDECVLRTSNTDTDGNMDAEPEADLLLKKSRVQKEMTFQDMYNNQDLFDDDDDDSDWEPIQKHVEITKWFCTNCTMVNYDDILHCDICGEHKESGILRHGYFASPFLQDAGPTEFDSEVEERYKDIGSQDSALKHSTVVGFDERMLLHSEVKMKSHPHPERPDRLRAIAASLATAGIFPGRCYPISAREITKEELQMVHSVEHVESVELTSHLISSYFTPDTYANEHSARAARLAAGLCADLASAIFSGSAKNGFALVRPPGHHAGVRQAMGFCLHNNAAVAALAAQVAGAKKVLIVDWDVHHGNGTQEIFEQNKSVLYISLHRHEGGKFYPGTGAAHEVGTKGAEGYCVNVPWSRGGVGDNDYIFAFQHVVLPIASEFAPDFTIVSAGFDAARGDPLGCCDVTPVGYAQMTHMLNAVTGGKLLVILEGGYNLRSISSSALAVIKVLLDESAGCELANGTPSKAGLQTVLEVLKIQMNFWSTLESRFTELQSQWGIHFFDNKKKQLKKRRRGGAPIWWKWGRKRLLYHFLGGHLHVKSKSF